MTAIIQAAVVSLMVFSPGPPSSADEKKRGRLEALRDKVTEATVKTSKKMLAELKEDCAVIKEAGFEMATVSIEVGISPAISVDFVRGKKVGDEVMESLIEENKEDKTLLTILKTLSAANELNVAGYKLEKVTVVLSVSPKASIALSPAE
jgi:hypothetical protein